MSSIEAVNHLQIPLQELSDASNGFSDQNLIAKGRFGRRVFIGKSIKHGKIAIKMLDPRKGQGDQEFRTEIALLSLYKHENIVSLIGFCDENGQKILVYRYEGNGSLDNHLSNTHLTWIQRLHICLDAARGLQYLHDDVGADQRIIHRDVKSANILLDENWKAKISDFGFCREIGPANKQTAFLISNACGTPGYIDPEYYTPGYLTRRSDVYSFGVVLFEVLCGRPAVVRYFINRNYLTNLIKTHWRNNTLDEIIFSALQKQIKPASFLTFRNIACQCLMSRNDRPTMKKVVKQLQEALNNQLIYVESQFMSSIEAVKHLQIPLRELFDATNEFSDQNIIAKGGFGNVYKGESVKHGKIAIKMLDPGLGQGDHEFRTEIAVLSVHKHENIASLIGFCDEDQKKILVYKYECNGSLDKHLINKDPKWIQLLQMLQDAARGLQYLHKHRIIHGDVKSGNILLDENWKAKISDFGFCTDIGPVNDQTSFIISCVCGTAGYTDPEYYTSGYLTQRSDVYSFGVVMFEVLCGRPAIVIRNNDNRDFLTNLIRTHWRNNTLDEIISSDLQKQIKPASLVTFINIAYQCLKSGNERPTMKKVVEQLQKALNNQLTSPSDSDDSGFATHLQGQSGHDVGLIRQSFEASGETSANTYLIGMETRMQELKSFLEVWSGGFYMVGICGMWGSGKSTLASSVYDEISHKFEGSCFVKNVRARSRMHGLKTLQEEILSNVLKSEVTFTNLEQGTYMMETSLRQNSVLIVLDDVYHTDHLKMLAGSPNWFGNGSRVIFTTRKQYLLNVHNVLTFNVRMLDNTEAFEVFSWHAFGKREPVQDFENYSRYMVSKCGRHPSVLKSLGSFLHGKDRSVWMRILDRLEGISDDEILKSCKKRDDGVVRNFFDLILD